jgi:hypothetical protein
MEIGVFVLDSYRETFLALMRGVLAKLALKSKEIRASQG